MKRKIFTLILSVCLCSFIMGQEAPTAVVKRATVAPVIDGNIDDVWATANKYTIKVPFQAETPTLGEEGTTTWKALWNDDGIFVLVEVNDDVWAPAYEGNAPSQTWIYDKTEVYFDVNFDKKDGGGTKGDGNGAGNGHYQFAPAPIVDEVFGDMNSLVGSNGATYCFKLIFPSYLVEYFIPFSKLIDKDGIAVDRNGEIGFDITILDSDVKDPVRNRMNWANAGGIDESWNNMDDCGIITLEGALPSVMIESISLTGGNAITVDNGTLQFGTTILPADATNKVLNWSVTNGTGQATISETGLLTGIVNGTVTVLAVSTDGAFVEKTIVVNISGQVIDYGELSILKDGLFKVEGPVSNSWTTSDPKPEVVDGKLVCTPTIGGNTWDWNFRQTPKALPNVPYIFSFVAYADAERTASVDFEDNETNTYNRYGTTTSPLSADGKSQWDFTLTTIPTKYTFDVNFTGLTETSEQKLQFMFGGSDIKVYIDSIVLVTEADFALAVPSELSTSKVQLFPNPVVNELTISGIATANAKVSVYNALGQKLMERTAVGNQANFDVANLRKGLYIVRFDDGTSIKFLK